LHKTLQSLLGSITERNHYAGYCDGRYLSVVRQSVGYVHLLR